MGSSRKFRVNIQYENILVAIAIVIPLFCGISMRMANIVSFTELFIILLLYNRDEFWITTPVYFIFYSQLLLVGASLSLFNVYCIICVFRLFREVRYIRIRENLSKIILYLLMLYAAIVCAFWRSVWEGFILALQGTAVLSISLFFREKVHLMNPVRKVFVLCCINAGIYGVLFKNIVGDYQATAGLIEYNVRYSGTASDPNYMAFFYCLGICYLLFMKGVKPWLVGGGCAALLVATALTGSLTALITIAAIFSLRVVFSTSGNKRTRILCSVLIVTLIICFVWYLFTDAINIPILNTYKSRILERLDYIHTGKSLSAITSGRTSIQEHYMNFYTQDNILRNLFGGYQINTQGIDSCLLMETNDAPHNTYIDVLMTCGFIGLVMFVMCFVMNICKCWKKWKNGDPDGMIGMICTFSTVIFIAGLSVFPAANYMYFLMV